MSHRSHAEKMRRIKRRQEAAEDDPIFDDPEYYTGYQHDALRFVREVIGLKDMDPGLDPGFQEPVLEAASDPDEQFILLQAGRGTGKSTTLAWLLMWWLLSRPFSRVIIVTPAFERQASRYLFPEVSKWCRRSPHYIPLEVRKKSVEVKGFKDDWFALAVQGQDADRVEGAHAESMMTIADEAKGLDADVIDALHGTQTSTSEDRLYVMASVPGGPSGPFYEAARSSLWKKFKRPCHTSPLVSDEWIEQRREDWGANSPMFRAHVMAEFPDEEEGVLFPMSMIDATASRDPKEIEHPTDAISIGVDPAHHGPNRTAVAIWKGYELVDVKTRRGMDTMETSSWVHSLANRRRADRVAVDIIGIGAGVGDRLDQLANGYRVDKVDVRGRAEQKELFHRVRAEIFWKLREAMEQELVSMNNVDQKVHAELASINFDYSPAGKIRIEQKKKTKKRVGESPDLADATVIGFPGRFVGRGGRGSKLVFSSELGMGGI